MPARKAGIPTGRAEIFSSYDAALAYLRQVGAHRHLDEATALVGRGPRRRAVVSCATGRDDAERHTQRDSPARQSVRGAS